MNAHQAHALYRFYADDGTLLYVGITNNPGNRFNQHGADKPWWHEVRGITMELYPDRPSVLAAEARAIAVENPRYNRQRPKHRAQQAVPARPQIVWLCAGCGDPVTNGAGYIHVSMARVHEVELFWRHREHAERLDEERGTYANLYANLTDIESWPTAAPWLAHHRECDPHPEDNEYWFDVARARTHAQLLNWTAHFLESKTWIQHTDWHAVINRLSGFNA